MKAPQAIHRYIETHRDEHIENLRAFLRQPAISAENVGIRESAGLLMDAYRALGCQEVELIGGSNVAQAARPVGTC